MLDPEEAIAWCDSKLVDHSLYTAAIACRLFGSRWLWRARASNIEPYALVLAAVTHDAGKAAHVYQDKAVKSCRSGGSPSFRYHEILSAIALAGSLSVNETGAVTVIAVLLHHHGMTSRYPEKLDIILKRILKGKTPGLGVPWEDDLESALADSMDFIKYIVEKARTLSACDQLLENYEPERVIERRPHIQEAVNNIINYKKGRVRINNKSMTAYHELIAAATALTGFIAVSDSLSAAIERRYSKASIIDVNRLICEKSYAIRVLIEMTGTKAPEVLWELLRLRQAITSYNELF